MSRGNVKRSATQAAEPAVSNSTAIPGRFRVDDTFLTEMGFEAAVVTAVLVVVEVVAAAAADILLLPEFCLLVVVSSDILAGLLLVSELVFCCYLNQSSGISICLLV